MVRLKEITRISQNYKFERFQFQYGSIKSVAGLLLVAGLFGFNSNMVRLKAKMQQPGEKYLMSFNSNMVRLKVIYSNNS